MIGAFLNASFFVPQIILLYKTKKVKGLSFPMFLVFNMIQLVTVLHGYMIEDPILMWGYALSFLTCGWVVILIIIYRRN
jgi:MtN3 and saliva related transmembrane protein